MHADEAHKTGPDLKDLRRVSFEFAPRPTDNHGGVSDNQRLRGQTRLSQEATPSFADRTTRVEIRTQVGA